MELTSIGYLYIPIALWCFFHRQEKHLVSLLLVSTVLQASAVVNIKLGIQAHGLNPFMCTVGLLALKMLPRFGTSLREITARSLTGINLWLGGYLVWAAAVTLVMPLVFEGLPVRHHSDAYFGAAVSLHFSVVNAWQIVGLWAVAVMFAFPTVQRISQAHLHTGIKQGLLFSFILVALANLYEQAAIAMSLPSLVSFWASNPGYIQRGAIDIHTNPGLVRVGVPFSEPSYASAYLAAFIGGICLLIHRGHRTWQLFGVLGLAVLVLLSTGGTTGMLALGVLAGVAWLFGVAGVANGILRGKLNVRSFHWVFTLLGLAVLALMLFAPGIAGLEIQPYISELIIRKIDINNSGTQARLSADIHGLQVLKSTYGLGVGLGSNRTSSFIASILSSVGVAGALLFVGFVTGLMRDYSASFSGLACTQLFALGAVTIMLLSMCLSIPDLNLPMLWVALWVLYVLRPSVRG